MIELYWATAVFLEASSSLSFCLIPILIFQLCSMDHNLTVLILMCHVFSVTLPPAGEVTAIVIGVMCGCVGLAVIIRFIVKTIR